MNAFQRAFRGIHPTRSRRTMFYVARSRHAAASDPLNPYKLPVYKDPQGRRKAREARRV